MDLVVEKKQRKKPVFHTIDSIRELFAIDGYTLVSTEYTPGVKVEFICDNGHEGSKTIISYCSGVRCAKCGIAKMANNNRIPFNDILNEFTIHNLTLITQESDFKNKKDTILEFICKQNHTNKCTFVNFKNRTNKCSGCEPVKINYPKNKKQITLQYVQELCDEKNFKLLSTKCNSYTDMLEFVCNNGHTNINTIRTLRNANPCKECNGTLPLTIERIKKAAEQRGFTLLSVVFNNPEEKLKFYCPKNHNVEMSYASWRETYGCLICAKENYIEKKTHDFSFVKEKFEEKNCVLINTEYTGCSQKLRYVCPNNHTIETTFQHFYNRNMGCAICSSRIAANTSESAKEIIRENKFNNIKESFKLEGYTILSNEYKNSNTKLEYKCPNNHIGTTTSNGFMMGYRCMICTQTISGFTSEIEKKIINENKLEIVREIFRLEGYTLLSDNYSDGHTKLDYKCPNNHNGAILIGDFKRGIRCIECDDNRSHGEIIIRNYFCGNKINYVREFKFRDCKYKKELPFDFYVNKNFLIEFDGGQHFKVNKFFGGQKCFENTQRNDIIKTKYCITNKIPLLRISHKEIKKIHQIIEQFMKDIGVRDKTKPFVHFSNASLYEHLIKVYNEELKLVC